MMKPNDKIGNKYRLERKLGSGSFGEVWEAEDIVLELKVAIKFYVALDDEGQKEFQTEYRNTYGLNHSNLLTAKSYDFFENRPYLVMDLCPDGSTAKLCGKITDKDEIWRFIRDVASGLAYLHAKDIVHQDIKPANVLKNASGDYVIADFGISKNLRATMRKQSKKQVNESTDGALSYMAPERFSSNPTSIKASDIWSLGASIYELITGILPFSGMGGILQQNGAEIPRLPKEFAEFDDVLRLCMAKNPWDRISASKLCALAEKALEGEVPFPDSSKKKISKWVWIAPSAILAVVAAVFLIGLPRPKPNPACEAKEQQFREALDSFSVAEYGDYPKATSSLNNAFILLEEDSACLWSAHVSEIKDLTDTMLSRLNNYEADFPNCFDDSYKNARGTLQQIREVIQEREMVTE